MKKHAIRFLLISVLFGILTFVMVSCANPNEGQKYKISFDSDGGSFVAPVTYTVGQDFKMPTRPTRYGYKFEGWFFEDGTEFINGKSEITAPTKLKAKWSIGEYTIKFDTDDLMDVDAITALYGAAIELPQLPQLGGCPFKGWFKEDLYTPFNVTTMPGEDSVAYALWDAGVSTSTGTVKVDTDGNCYTTMNRTLAVFSDYRISAGEYSVTIDFTNVKGAYGNNFGLIFGLTEPTSTSYWESGLGLSYYYFHVAIDVGAIQLAKVRGDHSLIYESKQIVMLEDNKTGWKDKYKSNDNVSTFGVSWNSGVINCYIDGELQISCADISPVLYGDKIGVRAVGAGLTFESKPTIKPLYCTRFDTDGAEEISPIVANSAGKITLPKEPCKEGYDFDCWKVYDGENYVEFNVDTPLTSDVQLKAFYTPKTYQIRLHRYLEDPDATDTDGVIEQAYLSKVTLPVPTRAGQQFDGWYLSDRLNAAEVSVMPLNGLDLYAKWSDDCVVTFDNDNAQEDYAQFVRYNGVAVQPQETPKKYGYNFKQWNFEGIAYDFNTCVTDDFTLKASYVKGVYTLTFYALNGDNPDEIYAQRTLEFGTEIDLENPEKDGWIFSGWYAEDLYTKIDVSTMLGEDRNLYASYALLNGADIHNVRGGYKKEKDSKTNQIIYRADKQMSVGLFEDIEFTEGCVSIGFDFSSWSPRAGFMFCAEIPDSSLKDNWEMGADVEYYTFNLDMGLGAFGLGKVKNGEYVTLNAVYIDDNSTSFKDKYLSNLTKTKIIVSVKLEKVGNALKIGFYIDGEKQLEYTDYSPLTGTGVGLSAYSINTKFKDFVIVDTGSEA